MDKDPVELQYERITKELPLMASELLLWPHSQICVVKNDFDDNDDNLVNRNKFEGYCNGYLNEDEEKAVIVALGECDNTKNRFDLSLPLVISARVLHSQEVGNILSPSVLSMECGAAVAWKYELSVGFKDGIVSGVHMFTRDENGSQILLTDKAVENLFAVVRKILSTRVARTGKVEFVIR